MLNNLKKLPVTRHKRWRLNQKGFTTLVAMLVTIGLLSGVLLSYGLISRMMNRNELYRREVVLGRNLLLSYDAYLFNNFGVLAYNYDTVDLKGLIASQFDEGKFRSVDHKVIRVSTLQSTSGLLPQIISVTNLRTAKGWINEQERVQQVINGVAPMVKDLKDLGQNKTTSTEVKRTAGETKRLNSYKQKMQQMNKTMKENGMDLHGGHVSWSPSGRETAEDQVSVQWTSIKVNRDRSVTFVEKGYLAAYIMGVLSDRVTCKAGEQEFYDHKKRTSPMKDGEVEYVLVGSHSRALNYKVVAGEIFAIRTGVHMKAVMMDRPLMMQLTEESVALAALMPVIPQPAILTSLVAAEAAERASKDLAKLLNGEGVSLFPGASKLLYYDDYLKVLLLGNSDTVLMERMLEIVSGAYKLDVGSDLNLEQMVVRHQIEAVVKGRILLKVEDGYYEKQEKGASWLTKSP